MRMHNWDYDLTTLKAGDEAEQWKLERMILYGLHGERIPLPLLRKHWQYIKDRQNIPKERIYFLGLFV